MSRKNGKMNENFFECILLFSRFLFKTQKFTITFAATLKPTLKRRLQLFIMQFVVHFEQMYACTQVYCYRKPAVYVFCERKTMGVMH